MGWIDQFSLENQVAIVTGAAGGLGCELVKILADAGACIVLADTDERKLNELSQKVDPASRNVLVQECDVTQKRDILRLIDSTHKKFQTMDVVDQLRRNFGCRFLAVWHCGKRLGQCFECEFKGHVDGCDGGIEIYGRTCDRRQDYQYFLIAGISIAAQTGFLCCIQSGSGTFDPQYGNGTRPA